MHQSIVYLVREKKDQTQVYEKQQTLEQRILHSAHYVTQPDRL